MGGNNEFFENFERNKYLKKLPSMQRDNVDSLQRAFGLKGLTSVHVNFLKTSMIYGLRTNLY